MRLSRKSSKLFACLEENTKQILDKIYDNITRALAGSVGDTLISLGYSIPEVMGLIDKVVGNSKTKLDELKNKADELTEKLMSGKGGQNGACGAVARDQPRNRKFNHRSRSENHSI